MNNIIPPCFYRISAKALIHNEEGKFLLVRELNGLWELPGGGIDYGENPEECLKREILEEMGLKTIHIARKPCYFFTCKSLKGKYIARV